MSITTKKEYLDQLHKYLKKLPREDYEDAMEYFTEYFEETDDEGAQKLMEELGTPKQAARDIFRKMLLLTRLHWKTMMVICSLTILEPAKVLSMSMMAILFSRTVHYAIHY